MGGGAIVVWLRRDLRLADHPALAAAAASGRPVIPVFVCDSLVEETGAAAKWRLGSGIAEFARSLAARGSRLVLRRGEAGTVLPALVAETGASAVYWTRAYGPAAVARDTAVKAGLRAWLRRFHVTPRDALADRVGAAAAGHDGKVALRSIRRGFAVIAIVTLPEG